MFLTPYPMASSQAQMGLPINITRRLRLHCPLVNLFQTAISEESLHAEMLQAFGVTLQKPGKDPTLINFHPISLLNSEVKIYAKLLATRLLDILPSLVQPDQKRFTKGRQAADATRRIINILHHAELTRTPSLLLAIDTERAFNRVHWCYMRLVLDKYGFSGVVLWSILALYSVYTSGLLSKKLTI